MGTRSFRILLIIISMAALCCNADAQDVFRKSIQGPEVVSGDYYKIDLGYLYDGERYEISVVPMPDVQQILSWGCGYKIYKWSEEQSQLDEITGDWDTIMIPAPSFQINDISANSYSTGHYYLLLTTKKEFDLCLSCIVKDIIEPSICRRIEPGINIDWRVQATKLIDVKTAENWNERAEVHLKNNESADAIEDLKYATEINPQLAEAWNNLGLAQSAQGTLDSAISSFEKAIQIDPNFADAWYNYGFHLSEQGRYKESTYSCDRAMSLNPYIKDTHKEIISEIFYKYGCALIDQGMIPEAVEVFSRSEDIDPEIVIRHKSTIGETLYKKGLILAGRDEYFNATLVMDRAVRVDPEIKERYCIPISQIWYELSKAFEDRNEYENACDAAQKAIELNPQLLQSHHEDISKYYSMWGDELLCQGSYEASCNAYNLSIKLDPEKRSKISEFCCRMARDLTQKAEYQNATIVYDMAIDIQPELLPAIKNEITHAYSNWGKSLRESRRCQECVNAFNKVLELKPGDNLALSERSICQKQIDSGLCN